MAEKKSTRKSAATTKKKAAKAVKKTAKKAAPARKTAKTAKTAKSTKRVASAARSTGGGRQLEERQRRVAEAAYLRAERYGFQGDPVEHWLAAEAEIEQG